MTPIAKGNVEILIHTSAPSLGVDDARYRSLAQAYLDFQPTKRRKLEEYTITPGGHHESNTHTHISSQRHESRHSTQEERESRASWQPDEDSHESMSQERPLNDVARLDITELLTSPELSFLSVLDNRASPAIRGQVTWRHHSSQERPPPTPGNEVPDSQPELNRTIAAFSSPTRILEVFLQNRDGSSSGPSTDSQRYSGGLQLQSSSQRESLGSTTSHRRKRDEKHSSLEVELSNAEESSSSQSLPRLRNQVIGSPDLGADCANHIAYSHPSGSSRIGFEQDTTIDTEIGDKTISSQRLSSNESAVDGTLAFGVTKQRASQSSHILTSSSSPSPIRSPTKQSDRVLRRKSPNVPETQPSTKRKTLATISETPASSAPSALVLPELPAISRPTKKRRVGPASSPLKPSAHSSSSQLPFTSSATRSKTTSWTEKLEIHPPPPQTSLTKLTPEMLISSRLHELERKIPLANYFHPNKSQTREIRPMERGYWLINCSAWTKEVRDECWNFLGQLIGEGRAGWGVWCMRDEDFESFRFYCWGVVVGHIYLALIAGSLNKTGKSEACWIDGGGEVVIRMRS